MTKSHLHSHGTHLRALRRSFTFVLVAVAALSCDRRSDTSADTSLPNDSAADTAALGEPDAPLAFDPDSLHVGDTLGTMIAADLSELRVDHEGRWVGTVRFTGETTLNGRYHPHFDYPEVQSTCFEVDDVSAVRLPRFAYDERRVWFCFENQEDAARSLGPPGSSGDATIVIDRYATIRSFTDAVDAARLVRVLSREPEGSGGPPPPDGGDR